MTKIGIGRIGSGTIGNPTVPTTGAMGPARTLRQTHKEGSSAANDPGGMAIGIASRAPLGTYITDLHDNPVGVAGLGGGLRPLSFKLLARSNRSWPGPPMYVDISGRSHNGFSASLAAWVGGSRLSMHGGSTGYADSPSGTEQSPQQPRIEARFRLVYTGTTFIIGKYGTNAANSCYKLELVNGAVKYTYSDGSTLHTATSENLGNFNFPEMSDVVIAAEHRNNGPSNHTNVTFYFSQDDGETWRQFGATTAEATTITVASGSQNLKVGPGLGEIFWARVYNATNGVMVAEFDASDLPTGTTQWGSVSNLWTLENTIGSTNPELVQDGEVSDWALNYNTDVLVDDSPLVLDVAGGGSVSTAVKVLGNPPVDVQIYNPTGINTGRLGVLVTSTGALRAIFGDNIFETHSAFGDNVVTLNFDSTEVVAYNNGLPMPALATGRIPLTISVAPLRSGDGSTDNELLLLAGFAVTDRMLDDDGIEIVRSILASGDALLGPSTPLFCGPDTIPSSDLLPGA